MGKILSFILQVPLKDKIKISTATILFILSFITSVIFAYKVFNSTFKISSGLYTVSNSIRDIKRDLNIPRSFLIRELNFSMAVPNKQPIFSITNISQKVLDFRLKRALFRYYSVDFKSSLFFTLSFFGLVVLIYASQRKQNHLISTPRWTIRNVYTLALLFSVLIVGFLLGKTPNPMEAVVKGIKELFGFGIYSFYNATLLVLFIIASIIGNKIICGWACPFGALQELIFIFSTKIKKHILPFYLTNFIRILVFSLTVLFGVIGNSFGLMLYNKINPFNIFVPYLKPGLILFTIIFFGVTSLFFYRPFCQFICPFGLISWVLEKVSIFKIRVDRKKCVKCGECYKSCPTGAIKNRVMGKKIPRECYSCGRCLNQCPYEAIRYN